MRIGDNLALKNPLIQEENSFCAYFLAKKHDLGREADQESRFTLRVPMTIEDLENTGKLEVLSGDLHQLCGYHQRVRECLAGEFITFMTFGAGARINFRCIKLNSSDVPIWLRDYVNSVAVNPALFNLSKFHLALTRHVVPSNSPSSRSCQSCASISFATIDTFWTALSGVIEPSIENVSFSAANVTVICLTIPLQAETNLRLESEMRSRQSRYNDPTADFSPPQCPAMQNADVILQSSDGVHFHVHKSILSMSSPFFHDMLSVPQPADSELVDGLLVVYLTEDAEVLHNLVTLLYPIPFVTPDDYDKALTLLSASHKYDMAAVQSSIRAKMKSKDLHPLTAAATFRAYCFASAKGLTQEMECVARLSLDFPMTFESIGDELAMFGGWALRDLARYRKRCRDSLVSCLESLLDLRLPPSDIWVGCQSTTSPTIAWWLQTLLTEHIRTLRGTFALSLLKPSSFRAEYLASLQSHVSQTDCTFCSKVHIMHGETFCVQAEKKLQNSLDRVSSS